MDHIFKKLEEYGADLNSAMDRFFDDKELYIQCVKSLLECDDIINLNKLIKKQKYDKAYEISHMLKGVSANLGLNPLYEIFYLLTENIKSKNYIIINDLITNLNKSFSKLKSCFD
ncbi:MAG: Hpt domain-containing protein [Oscillospiraceae bacterium]